MATERPSDQKIQTEKGKAELKRKQYNASINIKPDRGGGGGPRAYVGHLTFQKNFGQNPHRGAPKLGQIRSNTPTFSINLYWK